MELQSRCAVPPRRNYDDPAPVYVRLDEEGSLSAFATTQSGHPIRIWGAKIDKKSWEQHKSAFAQGSQNALTESALRTSGYLGDYAVISLPKVVLLATISGGRAELAVIPGKTRVAGDFTNTGVVHWGLRWVIMSDRSGFLFAVSLLDPFRVVALGPGEDAWIAEDLPGTLGVDIFSGCRTPEAIAEFGLEKLRRVKVTADWADFKGLPLPKDGARPGAATVGRFLKDGSLVVGTQLDDRLWVALVGPDRAPEAVVREWPLPAPYRKLRLCSAQAQTMPEDATDSAIFAFATDVSDVLAKRIRLRRSGEFAEL